ncbi:NF-kappa-B inhibitor epsilon-like isoform X2 [Planococcus citri]|uniref:NF-kappa-B inhibitor epsilon-like isoform X2 n=1 Tax=Planococcus citri TaxID=170843 RepID=UPI0031F9EB91
MPFDHKPNQNTQSSHSGNSRVDMKDTKCVEQEDCNYDSGVISEIISESCESIQYSEGDIGNDEYSLSKPTASRTDSILDKETKEDSYSDSAIDVKTRSDMNLDSGFISEANIQYSSKSIECEKEPPLKVIEPKLSIPWEILYHQDDDGNTPLHHAVMSKNEILIKYITFNTPASDLLDIRNHNAQTCLHLSVLTNQPRITRFLLLGGAKPFVVDSNGNTALHLACQMKNLRCVEALCDEIKNSDRNYYRFKYTPIIMPPQDYINETNYDGLSCLHIATINKQDSIFEKLMMTGADINIKEHKAGCTVLHEAVATGSMSLIRLILRHPYLNIDQKNYSCHTAYQLSWSHPKIAKLLLENHATKLDFVEYQLEDESSDESDSDDEYPFHSRNDSPIRNFTDARSEVVV